MTFASACHHAARRIGGRVEAVQSAREPVTRNFHEAVLVLRNRPEKVRVVCNAHYPLIAFASPRAGDREVLLRFIDCPELAEALGAAYSILGSSDAGAAVSEPWVTALGEAERAQLRYWKPQRIGDVIFNHWD